MQDKPSTTSLRQQLSIQAVPISPLSHHHHVSSRSWNPSTPAQHSKCFLMSIPDESLTHITTFIGDPPSLLVLSRVNLRLRDHLADDNTWYRAFAFHFLGVGPECEPEEGKRLMLRRSESTWKKEYIRRFNLVRRWEKSRSATLSYQPHYWNVSSMHLLENVSLMTANLQYGIVTRSFPLTGKILKGYLDASGTTNGQGIGNPNEEFSPNVSCIALSSCGGTGRIAWGFRNGEVAATFAPRVMDSNRSAARYVRCAVEDEHAGEVRCVLFAGKEDELVVSACKHGQVKLWDAKRMRCLWTGFGRKPDAALPDACAKVAFNVSAGVILTAMEGGDIVVWSGFLIQEDGLGSQRLVDAIHEHRIVAPADNHTVDTLFVDPNSSPSQINILVHYANDRHFLRLVVHLPSCLVMRTYFQDGPLGPLMGIRPCFAVLAQDQSLTPLTPALLTPSASDMPALNIALAQGRVVPREHSFILAGDSLGTVCIWNWDAEGSFVKNNDAAEASATVMHTHVNPSRKWEAHDDGAVCAIEVSGAVVITGSTRGTLKVWDSLTLDLLRSFASPASKPSLEGEWDPVGQIIVRGDSLVSSVGSRILTWQAGVVAINKKGKGGKHGGKPKGRAPGSSLNKWQQQIELNRDIRESQRLLEDERLHTQQVYGRERAQLSTLDQLGLDEREAVEYLLMLSREEEEQRRASETRNALSGPWSSDSTAARTIELNDDIEGVFALEEHSGLGQTRSSAQSTSSSSLFSSTSDSWTNGNHSSSPRAVPSTSNSKVQVSPPFLPEPTEAGLGTSPLYLAGGMSPRSSSGIPRSPSQSLSSSSGAEAFPVISSSPSTPSRSISSHQLTGSWSRGSPRSIDSMSQARNHWSGADARGSSSTSSGVSTNSSPLLLAQSPPQVNSRTMSREEEEDAELRFVLELSLAEARSQGGVDA